MRCGGCGESLCEGDNANAIKTVLDGEVQGILGYPRDPQCFRRRKRCMEKGGGVLMETKEDRPGLVMCRMNGGVNPEGGG